MAIDFDSIDSVYWKIKKKNTTLRRYNITNNIDNYRKFKTTIINEQQQ